MSDAAEIHPGDIVMRMGDDFRVLSVFHLKGTGTQWDGETFLRIRRNGVNFTVMRRTCRLVKKAEEVSAEILMGDHHGPG